MSTATAIHKSPISLLLKIVDGPHEGEAFTLQKEVISIGRGAENDIVLPNDPKLSRNHIKVLCQRDMVTIENLSARNPILYKDNYEQKVELNPNDKVRVGETEIQFIWDAQPGERTVQVGTETLAQIHAEKTMVHMAPPEPPALQPQEPVVPTGAVYPPGATKPAVFTPQGVPLPPQSEHKSVDFKSVSLGAKPGVPEVRYTPTMGGLEVPSRAEAGVVPNASSSASRSARRVKKEAPSSRGPLILIALVVLILGTLVFLSDDGKKTKKPAPLKDTDQIASELAKSAQMVEQHVREKHLTEDGRMERQFESAQSYYIKGFRDYRQGQYGRAIMSFQASLSFDPNHVLSRKYLNQSIKKQAEIIQFNLDQARRYRMKNNFRLCRSAAQQVMILRKDQNDPQYKDAKGIFDECDTLSKGRF